MDSLSGKRNPRTMRLIVVVIAVIIIVGAVTTYYVLTRPPANVCALQSKDPLVIDQPEVPDSLDPHVTFSTPGWGIVQQIYQSLVNYNGTGYTNFVPVLAKSWTVSSTGPYAGFNFTFALRQDVHFSNNDSFNAYVMWFSLNRALAMNQQGSFILQENFWYPGVNYSSDSALTNGSAAWVISNLNTFDFENPTAPQQAVMKLSNQSFQVIDKYTIQLNMGYGYLGDVAYANLLPAIAGPIASAVDPVVIQAHGGVIADKNPYMSSHMIGTGPFVLAAYDSGQGYLLQPDPNYWAKADAAAEPWNNIIQPAKASVQVKFQTSGITAVSDIKSGTVATVSFAYVGPSQIDDLRAAACVQVTLLNVVYGSTAGGWWIYMNQQQQPFNDIHVRAAVVHAINYTEIIQKAFNGYAERWVGPVPPGYPHYNPDNLPFYQYNLTLAKQEMNQSQWPLSKGGYSTPINYMYIKLGDWEQVALLLQADLAKIGLNIVPVGLNNLDDLYTEQGRDSAGNCISESNFGGGPFYMGQEFYTSDYISPDDWTQNNALSYGSANDCMARYSNVTMDNLVIDAAGTANQTQQGLDYAQMTKMMYDNYTVAWLVVPDQFQITYSGVTGFVSNPMGAALPFVVMQNTMHAS